MRPQTLARPTPLMAGRAMLSYCTPAPPPRCAGTSKIFLQRRVWEKCTRRQLDLLQAIGQRPNGMMPFTVRCLPPLLPQAQPHHPARTSTTAGVSAPPFRWLSPQARGLFKVHIHARLDAFAAYANKVAKLV